MLLLALLATAVTAGCVPSKEPAETREEVVDSYMAALSAHDFAALGKYTKPGAKAVTGSETFDLAELLSALNGNTSLTVVEKRFNQDKTIVVHYRTSPDSEDITVSFTQDGGCITEMRHVP